MHGIERGHLDCNAHTDILELPGDFVVVCVRAHVCTRVWVCTRACVYTYKGQKTALGIELRPPRLACQVPFLLTHFASPRV